MIKAAIERGEFKNLEGEGKPIDLDAYFVTPEDVRMGYSVLKSNDIVPEEVDRLKEIAEIKEQIENCSDTDKIMKLKKLLNERTLALSLILERNKRR